MNPDVIIARGKSDDQGTFGRLVVQSTGWGCITLELPWLDNIKKRSCIPDGDYQVAPWVSRKFGHVFHILDVPDRADVLIHNGNWAGRIPEYKTHVQGCILLGRVRGTLASQNAVLVSRPTVRVFVEQMGRKPFNLRIIWS